MKDYRQIEENLNKKSQEILIKLKEIFNVNIDEFIGKDFIIVDTNKEEAIKYFGNYDNIPSGHGGRAKKDGYIHFYPFSKTFEKCKTKEEIEQIIIDDLLVHEILHYFIRFDIELNDEIEDEFQHFLSEGIVQFFTEKYHRLNNLNTPISNYDKNVKYIKILYWSLLNEKNNEDEVTKLFFTKKYNELIQETTMGKHLLNYYKEDRKMHETFNQVLEEIYYIVFDKNDENQKELNKIKNHYNNIEKLEDMIKELYELLININSSLREECLNILYDAYPDYYADKKVK